LWNGTDTPKLKANYTIDEKQDLNKIMEDNCEQLLAEMEDSILLWN